MNTPTPIKRDKSIVSLSKEHHDGLLLAWKIRQGQKLAIDNSRIATYTVEVFGTELEPHFIKEENLLFVKLPSTDALKIKAEQQHAAIREKIAAFKSSNSTTTEDLLSFASLIDEHIRFEERILFPHLEQFIPRKELDEIGEQLEAAIADKKHLVWADEFWVKQ